MTRKTRIITICLAVAISATGLIALAGDLNPPVGPVAPTQRTPVNANMTPGDADSLFKITQPGSYYLTGNITGVTGKHGVEIAASGFTLDLNGFDLVGVAAMGAFDGVSVTLGGLTNIAVVNGSVRNWGDKGVDLATIAASNCRVADLLASGNSGGGLAIGSASTVRDCKAITNGGNGIATSFLCLVTHCTSRVDAGNGISVGLGTRVRDCDVNSSGLDGILATGGRCTILDCTVDASTGDGIEVTSDSYVAGNNCTLNGLGAGDGAGIHVTGSKCRIDGNHVISNDRGIDVDGSPNLIIRNSASANTTNYAIAASNTDAQVLAPGSAFVSTDPWANFSF